MADINAGKRLPADTALLTTSSDIAHSQIGANQQFSTNIASVDISTIPATVATFTNSTGKRLELEANISLSSMLNVATELDVEVSNTAGDPPLNVWLDYKNDTLTTHIVQVPSILISVADGETVSIGMLSNQTNLTVAAATVWTRK